MEATGTLISIPRGPPSTVTVANIHIPGRLIRLPMTLG